jgi:predicted AAA+ superfamily ATPase
MARYIRRLLDDELDIYLETFGAVLIRGPKWCGKTTTAEKHAKSIIKMQDPEKSEHYVAAAEADITLILNGNPPRLIDEWQVAPKIWDAVRTDVDEKGRAGLYILTGSRVPAKKSYKHSGAGRFGVLFMYPMSLFESGDSDGSVSLERLFSGKENVSGKSSPISVEELAYCICRGGWPANIGLEYRKCALRLKSYLELVYESDDLTMDKYVKDADTARSILRSYSRNISATAELKTIFNDVVKNDISISESRFYDYINALRNIYLIDDVRAWNPSIRSKTAVRSKPKRELVDPSIAALLLGITPSNFVDDFRTFGLLFESMCVRDLKIYMSSLEGKVYYYRDRYGLEADAVVMLDDGRYGLIEIKLGTDRIDEGAQNLCKLEELMQNNKMKPPSFKAVITGRGPAYKRNDDVFVIPIGCLRN